VGVGYRVGLDDPLDVRGVLRVEDGGAVVLQVGDVPQATDAVPAALCETVESLGIQLSRFRRRRISRRFGDLGT